MKVGSMSTGGPLMPNKPQVSISLYCASLEKELTFNRLSAQEAGQVTFCRDDAVYFSEYARAVVYAVVGPETAGEIWGDNNLPYQGGMHTLYELYWISTVLNPELSWNLKKKKLEATKAPNKQTRTVAQPQAEERKQLAPLKERLPSIEKFLRQAVVGQDEALETILDVLYREAAGLADPERPQAVLLFTGPSGSGKTHLAKALCVALWEEEPTLEKIGNPEDFFRIDCTLYQQKHEISNLIGSPQGYIGSDLGSPLPDFLREHPYGNLILIDEVEKANPALHKLFMGLFDYGKIKDNKQNEVAASETLFIMTSNAGSQEAKSELDKLSSPTGFVAQSGSPGKLTSAAYKKRIEEVFPPEFRGRVDEIVIFNHLDEKAVRNILDIEIAKMNARLKSKGASIRFTPSARDHIIKEAFSPELGARKLTHYVAEKIIKPLSRAVVSSDSSHYTCRLKDGELQVEGTK
jgi:ATP-dependent Clp protease ATP-binding subunit ClpA